MNKYIYELKMKVRDYECDLQGIVNNAMEEYTEFTSHITDIATNLYALADHFDERRN